ncbi:thioredoxin-like protein [Gonapodya prolifera JEL478]|uniref:Glutathione S-transferase kappa n=1 Tax=Gonapodya prolifera (strain JEL478) TaxID=1344416 RepID=A0A139AJT4_GONPJ|nr:thioredoxin-like protein [Gonapodya prolifera JEL478]|eukprot:KXS17070.1 thioredoxin-like protein [Gonapodya prolifera JEL478]
MVDTPSPIHLEFYFDFLSPYAYLAHKNLLRIRSRHPNLRIELMPTLFAGLLNHWGQLGPAEVPPKREWMSRDIARYAHLHGFPFGYPKVHPFKPLLALRLSLKEIAGDLQEKIVEAFFDAAWGSPFLYDLGSPGDMHTILTKTVGLSSTAADSLLSAASSSHASSILREQTAQAIRERGVFGVPSFWINGELYWGNDNVVYVEREIEGRGVLKGDERAEAMWAKWKTLVRGTDRPGMNPVERLKGKL